MNNKLIMSVVGIVVGIILVGSLLAPVVNDAQRNAGDVNTISNPVQHNSYLMGELTGEDTVTYRLDSSLLYVNDVQVPISHSGTVGTLAMGPEGYIGVRNNGGALYYFEATSSGYTMHTLGSGGTYTITASSVSDGTSTWPITSIWACGVATESPVFGAYPNGTHDAILNNIDQVFGWAEVTLSDSSKIIVSFSGDSAVAEGHTVSVIATTSDYDGYTDAIVLEDYALLVDGTQTVNSFWTLMPATIEAHEASGGVYSLYGVLPLMVIVALLVAAVGIVKTRN